MLASEINKAVEILKSGGIICYPAGTVWGIGCDATNEESVGRIKEIKGNQAKNGLIVLFDSPNMLSRYIREIPEIAFDIIETSDSPITIILPGGVNLAAGVTASDGSLAFRITTDEICLQMIRKLRKPLVSTSANYSGKSTPLSFYEIENELLEKMDFSFADSPEYLLTGKPSPIIKIELNGQFSIIRK